MLSTGEGGVHVFAGHHHHATRPLPIAVLTRCCSADYEAIRGSHATPLGFNQLSPAAVDLILLGDLTGRYATGNYSRQSSSGTPCAKTARVRPTTATGSPQPSPATWPAPAEPATS